MNRVMGAVCEADRSGDSRVELPRSLAAASPACPVVAVEGSNGTGKTPLCRMLSETFAVPVLRGVPAAWEHHDMKLHMIGGADWLASAMYFLSGVIESSREAQSREARFRIMDRSMWSTLAVHYAHDPGRLTKLLQLVELAAGRLIVPGLTIALEASYATCRARIERKKEQEQQWDAAAPDSQEFFAREQEFYHWLAGQWPRVVFISTDNRAIEDVYRQAVAAVEEWTRCSP